MRDHPPHNALSAQGDPHAALMRRTGFGFFFVAVCWLMLIVGLIAGVALERWVL